MIILVIRLSEHQDTASTSLLMFLSEGRIMSHYECADDLYDAYQQVY